MRYYLSPVEPAWKVASTILSGLFVMTCSVASQAQQAPTVEQLSRHAELCRKLLQQSVVDFYLPCVDREFGGYLQDVSPSGEFHGDGGKFLVFQGRQLWLFSVLADAGIDRENSLEAARTGFDFMQEHFLDSDRGGYYSQVARDGTVVDSRKHAYLNSFALYGLVAYYEATTDQRVLDAANRLFDTLEQHAYDRVHGGLPRILQLPLDTNYRPQRVWLCRSDQYQDVQHTFTFARVIQRTPTCCPAPDRTNASRRTRVNQYQHRPPRATRVQC